MRNENIEDKKRQRDKYEILVDLDIKAIDFNTDFMDNVLKFFFGTIVLGAFYMWCSSNIDSNFFTFVKRYERIFNYIIVFLPIILWVVYTVLLMQKMRTTYTKINIQYIQNYSAQRKIFAKFILEQLYGEKNLSISSEEILKLFKSGKSDITFSYNDFVKFIDSYLAKYKLKYPYNFSYHLSNLILYNEDIDGTLIKQSQNEYTFIIKENLDFVTRI